MTIIEAYRSALYAPAESPIAIRRRYTGPGRMPRRQVRIIRPTGKTHFEPFNPLPGLMVALAEYTGMLDGAETHEDFVTCVEVGSVRIPRELMNDPLGPMAYRIFQIDWAWFSHRYPGATFKLEPVPE